MKLSRFQRAVILGFLYSFIICVLFLRPGYLRSIDYFFPLRGGLKPVGAIGFIVSVITTLNNGIIAPRIREKIILLSTFFVPFVGGAFLLKHTKSFGAMLFAGMAMTANPYFYNRFVDGQLGMYLLFCTIPLWLYSLHTFFSTSHKSRYHYLIPVLRSLITTSISMHGAWFLIMSFMVCAIIYTDINRWKKYLIQISVLAGSILLVNSYRLIPQIVDSGGARATIEYFSLKDIEIFENYLVTDNNYLSTIALQGYRGSGLPRFTLQSYGNTLPPFAIFSLMFLLVLYGIYHCLSTQSGNRKKFARSLLIMMGISYILGLGTAAETIFANSNRRLYEHVPFFLAMREANKRLLLLAIGYAYFGGYAVYAFGKYLQGNYRKHIGHTQIATVLGIVILIGYTPSIFKLHTQIPVVDYPAERYTLRAELLDQPRTNDMQSCSPGCYDILVLPRHQYIGLSFTKKVVLNPAIIFFHPLRVLQGDNIEIGGIYRQGNNTSTQLITDYLSMFGVVSQDSIDNGTIPPYTVFIDALKNMGIKHIVLLKGADYPIYQPLLTSLRDQQFIQQITDTVQFIHYSIPSE